MLGSLREFFLLEKAAARAEATAAAPTAAPSPSLERAANERRRAADELVGGGHAVAALVLYRDALRLRARARGRIHADDAEAERAGFTVIERELEAVAERTRAPLVRALRALRADDTLAFDRLDDAALVDLRLDASDLFAWLDASLVVRTPRQVKAIRILRLLGVTLALALGVRVALRAFLTPANVALHKPVTASSRYPDTPESGALTDGDTHRLGVHTTVEDNPWVTIDLAQSYRVKKVRIHNRTDCCVDEVLPLIVEVGEPSDPAPFVAERNDHFEVWEIDVDGRSASTIKLHTRRKGYIALSEVEVLGTR